MKDYAPLGEMKMGFLFGQSLVPSALGSGTDYSFIQLISLFNSFRKIMADFKEPFAGMGASGKSFGDFFNQDIVRKGETSSANGNCSARGEVSIKGIDCLINKLVPFWQS